VSLLFFNLFNYLKFTIILIRCRIVHHTFKYMYNYLTSSSFILKKNNTFLVFAMTGDMDIRIANKYRLGRKIGGGSFGDIYVGKSKQVFIFTQ